MDGRDIGTVVFPDAEIKLFMTATSDVRAQRRFKELTEKGHQVIYNEVLQNIIKRDYIDSNRDDSPLIKAEGAIEIDNSNLSLDSQIEMIYGLIKKRLNNIE